MINQQSAAIRSTSSTKQHKLICLLRTNTWPLALDRQTTTATKSGTTATTKQAILPSTYHHLRVAHLNNRRNLYSTTLEAPGTQPLAMLLCGFSWRNNSNHYYLLLVSPCVRLPCLFSTYVRVPTEIQCTNAPLWSLPQYNGDFFTVILLFVSAQNITPIWK